MTDDQLLLVVLLGRPGTGKTTLAKRLAAELRGAYIRRDAVVGPMRGGGLTREESRAAEVGYEIARAVVQENLEVGVPVVVDGVHATHARRQGWSAVAETCSADLCYIETYLADEREHRRRVERRSSGEAGCLGPYWDEIEALVYERWDEPALGMRLAVETSDADSALAEAVQHLSRRN
jgi:predicted kinase